MHGAYLWHWNLWIRLFSNRAEFLSWGLFLALPKSFLLRIVVKFSEVRKFTLYKTIGLDEMKIYLDNSYWVIFLQQIKKMQVLLYYWVKAVVHGVTKSWTQLSDWTITTESRNCKLVREKPSMEKERWKASCSFINKLGQFLNNRLIEKLTHFSSNWNKLFEFVQKTQWTFCPTQ